MTKLNKKRMSFGGIVAVIGSVLISVGIAWLIAQNWHYIPAPLKIIILILATSSAYVFGTMLRVRGYYGIGKALLVLGALLYTLSIFLIAQIFSTSTDFQGMAWLLLLAWIGVFVTAYLFESSASLVVALLEFLVWLVIQFFAFTEGFREMISPGILAFYFLVTGVLVYGLSLWHRAKKQSFARLYQWWTAFYFLAFTYLLSSQTLLPMMWPKEATTLTPSIVFLLFLLIISLVALISGIMVSISKRTVTSKEIGGMFAIVTVLAALIGLTSFVSSERWGLWGGYRTIPLNLWALWIFINIVFILIILAVIGYGSWQRSSKIINLGIVFFALDIFTKYMGFVIGFRGYVGLSVIFIIGGIILLVGGWSIEKWRRKLIAQAT